MHEYLLWIHILGAMMALIVSAYGLIADEAQIRRFNLMVNLGWIVVVQAVTGLLVSFLAMDIDLVGYCARGGVYFSLVLTSLAVMSYRSKIRLAESPSFVLATLSIALYLAPLLVFSLTA